MAFWNKKQKGARFVKAYKTGDKGYVQKPLDGKVSEAGSEESFPVTIFPGEKITVLECNPNSNEVIASIPNLIKDTYLWIDKKKFASQFKLAEGPNYELTIKCNTCGYEWKEQVVASDPDEYICNSCGETEDIDVISTVKTSSKKQSFETFQIGDKVKLTTIFNEPYAGQTGEVVWLSDGGATCLVKFDNKEVWDWALTDGSGLGYFDAFEITKIGSKTASSPTGGDMVITRNPRIIGMVVDIDGQVYMVEGLSPTGSIVTLPFGVDQITVVSEEEWTYAQFDTRKSYSNLFNIEKEGWFGDTAMKCEIGQRVTAIENLEVEDTIIPAGTQGIVTGSDDEDENAVYVIFDGYPDLEVGCWNRELKTSSKQASNYTIEYRCATCTHDWRVDYRDFPENIKDMTDVEYENYLNTRSDADYKNLRCPVCGSSDVWIFDTVKTSSKQADISLVDDLPLACLGCRHIEPTAKGLFCEVGNPTITNIRAKDCDQWMPKMMPGQASKKAELTMTDYKGSQVTIGDTVKILSCEEKDIEEVCKGSYGQVTDIFKNEYGFVAVCFLEDGTSYRFFSKEIDLVSQKLFSAKKESYDYRKEIVKEEFTNSYGDTFKLVIDRDTDSTYSVKKYPRGGRVETLVSHTDVSTAYRYLNEQKDMTPQLFAAKKTAFVPGDKVMIFQNESEYGSDVNNSNRVFTVVEPNDDDYEDMDEGEDMSWFTLCDQGDGKYEWIFTEDLKKVSSKTSSVFTIGDYVTAINNIPDEVSDDFVPKGTRGVVIDKPGFGWDTCMVDFGLFGEWEVDDFEVEINELFGGSREEWMVSSASKTADTMAEGDIIQVYPNEELYTYKLKVIKIYDSSIEFQIIPSYDGEGTMDGGRYTWSKADVSAMLSDGDIIKVGNKKKAELDWLHIGDNFYYHDDIDAKNRVMTYKGISDAGQILLEDMEDGVGLAFNSEQELRDEMATRKLVFASKKTAYTDEMLNELKIGDKVDVDGCGEGTVVGFDPTNSMYPILVDFGDGEEPMPSWTGEIYKIGSKTASSFDINNMRISVGDIVKVIDDSYSQGTLSEIIGKSGTVTTIGPNNNDNNIIVLVDGVEWCVGANRTRIQIRGNN